MSLSAGRLAPRILRPKMGRSGSGVSAASAASTLNDGIVAFWKLDEASGTRADSVGSNDLTDNNTVGQGAAIVGGNSADFERNNKEYLSISDNADLSFGDEDFSFIWWVNFETVGDGFNRGVMSKSLTSGAEREYALLYHNNTDRFRFVVSPDGTDTTIVAADNFGSPSAGVDYMIFVYHDSVNNEIGISINNGTIDTAAHSGGVFDSGEAVHIGSHDDPTGNNSMDGRMDAGGVWGKVLSAAEVTEAWNDGAGKEYPF